MSGSNLPRRRASPTMAYGWIWPGLPRLWLGGEWAGLGWAAALAALLNCQLLNTLVYQELWTSAAVWAGWMGVGIAWIAGIAVNRRWCKRYVRSADSEQAEQTLFTEAFHDYLQANWISAETKCRELIRRRRQDVDARLLLATLLRHANRYDEAQQQLEALAKLEGAGKWAMEAAQEQRLLDEARDIANNSDDQEPDVLRQYAESGTEDSGESDGRAIRNAA